RDPDTARSWDSADRAAVRRPRVPAGARAPERRARRSRDAAAHPAREPPLPAPAGGLVPQRALSNLALRPPRIARDDPSPLATGQPLMAPASESKSAPPNIQDVFLNYVRREKLIVTIRMMDGTEVEGRIKNFDRFALVMEQSGVDHMIF